MRLHMLAQPHTQLTDDYLRCAYTQKSVKLCKMLDSEGIDVTVYGGEDNITPAKLVTCITKKHLAELGFNGPDDYLKNDFKPDGMLWKRFHQRAIYELARNLKKSDIIGTFSGLADKRVKEAFPKVKFVELGIGYTGIFADYRIFESYAWYNALLGYTYAGNIGNMEGRFYDTVIPNYFDKEDFPYASAPRDYFLFVGRMIRRKGLDIINEMAKRLPDEKFILCGQGAEATDGKVVCGDGTTLDAPNIEYRGTIDKAQRADLMSHAKALICPTLYLGPFEGVHVEAMMCGTPVLTSPFGAFTETFEHGVHGYRCHNIKQFAEAAQSVHKLDRPAIRGHAQSRFSTDVVAKQYVKYFELLDGIDRGGFYEM